MGYLNSNIDINQGESFVLQITASDSSGNLLDLTNYTVNGIVSQRLVNPFGLTNFSINYGSPLSSGIFTLTLPPSITSTLPVLQGVYQINASGLDGSNIELLRGYVNINPSIPNLIL